MENGVLRSDVRGLLPGHPLDTWNELVDSLRASSGQWAVFVGAGLSVGAGLPDWKRLTLDAMARFSVPHVQPLADAVYPLALGACEEAASPPEDFWQLINSAVCREVEPTATQSVLTSIPFEVFVTLNYDRLLEPGWSASRLRPDDGIMAYPALKATNLRDGRLVYLHGRCPGGTDCLGANSTVLTRKNYDEAYRPASPIIYALQALFSTYNVLFVATSLTDPDIGTVLNELGRMQRLLPAAPGPGPRKYVAVAPSESSHYVEGLDWQFSGMSLDISPLWYHRPTPGDHSNLGQLLESLARMVVRT